jgi:hypothetical protein
MNFGQVVSRAWQITRRWKVLWVLGFLVGLSSSISGGLNLSYRVSDTEMADWAYSLSRWPNATFWIVLIAGLTLVLLIALTVLSVVATGGLIAGVRQVEDEGSTTLRHAWRVGVRHFWRLFGLSLLVMLPAFLVTLVTIALLAFGIVGLTNSGIDSTGGMAVAHTLSVVCGSLLCCILVPIGVALGIVTTYAQRAAILENLPWIQAVQRGWQVLRGRLGPSLLLWLIYFAIGLGVSVLLGLGALPIVLALFALFQVDGATAGFVALAACAGLLTFAIYGLVEAILGTFTSAAWTLAYRQLTGAEAAAVDSVAAEATVEPMPEP